MINHSDNTQLRLLFFSAGSCILLFGKMLRLHRDLLPAIESFFHFQDILFSQLFFNLNPRGQSFTMPEHALDLAQMLPPLLGGCIYPRQVFNCDELTCAGPAAGRSCIVHGEAR